MLLRQALPQVPQLELSVCVFVHAVPHRLGVAPEHSQTPWVFVQFPPVQGAHTAPKSPQSVCPWPS